MLRGSDSKLKLGNLPKSNAVTVRRASQYFFVSTKKLMPRENVIAAIFLPAPITRCAKDTVAPAPPKPSRPLAVLRWSATGANSTAARLHTAARRYTSTSGADYTYANRELFLLLFGRLCKLHECDSGASRQHYDCDANFVHARRGRSLLVRRAAVQYVAQRAVGLRNVG